MSGRAGRADDRWSHLVNAAFRLEEAPGGSLSDARALVHSALEVFPATLDPLDDFEGYAVRRLLLALRRTLEARPDHAC